MREAPTGSKARPTAAAINIALQNMGCAVYLCPADVLVMVRSVTGCTNAPLPAESHTARRTHFLTAANADVTVLMSVHSTSARKLYSRCGLEGDRACSPWRG